ncbi:GFA family protein [Shewanella algae]|uniref:GFA family protein n=1 Tax=Shewanella algae TaxID=38313 RepID=UPI001AACA77D|nr:GFA family protein [Shewanella algae]MBO2603185.1 GFA family protein [Shewanella algae]
MKQYRGSCLCGKVRFEISAELQQFFLCHCSRCRKDSGSAHSANLFSDSAELTWLSGQDAITAFTLPGTRHSRHFCAVCGSALPKAVEGSHLLQIPAGSLDDEPGLTPQAHIFCQTRAAWDSELGTVPQCADKPDI